MQLDHAHVEGQGDREAPGVRGDRPGDGPDDLADDAELVAPGLDGSGRSGIGPTRSRPATVRVDQALDGEIAPAAAVAAVGRQQRTAHGTDPARPGLGAGATGDGERDRERAGVDAVADAGESEVGGRRAFEGDRRRARDGTRQRGSPEDECQGDHHGEHVWGRGGMRFSFSLFV